MASEILLGRGKGRLTGKSLFLWARAGQTARTEKNPPEDGLWVSGGEVSIPIATLDCGELDKVRGGTGNASLERGD